MTSVIRSILFSVMMYVALCDVTSKLDFGNEEDGLSSVAANDTSADGEDVEVKQTIIVSTKLKNNNRRGVHRANGDGTLDFNYGHSQPKQDSGEVPVYSGMRAVETTQIRTPDSRYKTKIYPDSVFVNRNLRDEYDIFPNIATNPAQWKPNNFYKNINWWGTDTSNYNIARRIDVPATHYNTKNQKKTTDDAVKEFYCRKCRELSGQQYGCNQIQEKISPWITPATTPKIKIDGKIAKLN